MSTASFIEPISRAPPSKLDLRQSEDLEQARQGTRLRVFVGAVELRSRRAASLSLIVECS